MVWRVCLFQMYSWNFEIFLGLLFGTYVACMEFIIYFSTSNRYWASYQHTNFSICLCHCLICYFFDNALTLDRFKTMVHRLWIIWAYMKLKNLVGKLENLQCFILECSKLGLSSWLKLSQGPNFLTSTFELPETFSNYSFQLDVSQYIALKVLRNHKVR